MNLATNTIISTQEHHCEENKEKIKQKNLRESDIDSYLRYFYKNFIRGKEGSEKKKLFDLISTNYRLCVHADAYGNGTIQKRYKVMFGLLNEVIDEVIADNTYKNQPHLFSIDSIQFIEQYNNNKRNYYRIKEHAIPFITGGTSIKHLLSYLLKSTVD